MAVGYLLAEAVRHNLRITEALEAANTGNARYFGLRLEPALTATLSQLV